MAKPGRRGPEESLAYLEGIFRLCEIVSERLNPDAVSKKSYAQIMDSCHMVNNVHDMLALAIMTKEACKSALDRLQSFALRLYTCCVKSVCCRPALGIGGSNHLNLDEKRLLAEECKANLTETVRMFLAIHQLSVIPTRSWEFTYFGLSSAVLLGILDGTKTDPEVRQLQGDLIASLSATTAREEHTKGIELSGPLSRALAALKNIHDHGTVIGQSAPRELNQRLPSQQTEFQPQQETERAHNRTFQPLNKSLALPHHGRTVRAETSDL